MKKKNRTKKVLASSASRLRFDISAILGLFLLIFLLSLSSVIRALEDPGKRILDYTLEVSFNIQTSLIKGVVTIPVKKEEALKLDMGKLKLFDVRLDQEEIVLSPGDETVKIHSPREGMLKIRYEGILKEASSGVHSGGSTSAINARGIFLTGAWYPKPDQMCHYHLVVTLPDGYEAVSEAETINKYEKDGNTVFGFDFPHPLDSIHLIATNRYRIVKDHFDGIEIFAYFFPEDLGLVKTYVENAKHYLQRYEYLIGRFPYKRFSIVENFLPTGYSMPTYTLLGQEVVRLPFIPETSLGHEILHQWFGNLVYIDPIKGNWAEGLTTFLADHLYEEEKGRGFEYRKGSLIDYQSYVNEKNDFPLKDFGERVDPASGAIGYGKSLMVFHMLKKLVGEECFYESIRYFTAQNRFRNASWEDIQRAFQRFYPKDLNGFFNQWIDEKGLPDLHLEEVQVRPSGAKFEVAFMVVQKGKVFKLDFPVAVYSYFGKTTKVFHLQKEKEGFKMIVDDIPEKVAMDEDYDVARTLSLSEFPPVIARLIGDEKRMVVLPSSSIEVYQKVVDGFKGEGVSFVEPNRIKYEEPVVSSLLILGADNPVVARLYGSVVIRGGFGVLIKQNPWNRSKAVGIFDARSKEEVEAAFQKIFHYGKYSAVAFDHGVNVYKEIDSSTRGITKELFEKPAAVEVSTLKTLPYVMDRVSDKKIIYVGETHDQFSNHVVELEIIKDLRRRGRAIAIGLEMFERPFQKVLDDYIEGKIDERDFLKGTEYFKRWGFDYNLYKPILIYARSEKIPVIALNIQREIVDKVFRSGLDSLSEEERSSLPSGMDFSNKAYQERLEKVFLEHRHVDHSKTRNFDFFYQAQILWDETMAESADRFLRTHPGDQLVVLAGSQHLAYGSGIPKRLARRNGFDYAIILNDADLEEDIADYVLFPGTVPGVTAPRLMVLLREEAGKVEITGFPAGSVAEEAGLRVGDIILAVSHTAIRSVEDVKIELLSKENGGKVRIKVLRKGFFGIRREMDFEMILNSHDPQ